MDFGDRGVVSITSDNISTPSDFVPDVPPNWRLIAVSIRIDNVILFRHVKKRTFPLWAGGKSKPSI